MLRRTAPYARAGGRPAAGPLRRFPFVIAALVVTIVAAFLLFGGTSRQPSGPAVNPWANEPAETKRVPATPSRGAMGLASDGAPRRVSAQTAP